MKYLGLSILILVLAFGLACTRQKLSTDELLNFLSDVQSPDQEAEKFRLLRDHADTLGIVAFDKAGKTLNIAKDNWWKDLSRLQITVNNAPVVHTVRDPKNVLILLPESGSANSQTPASR